MPLTKKRTQHKKSNKKQRQGKRKTKRQNTRKKLKNRRQRRKRLRGGGGKTYSIFPNNDNDETSQIDKLLKNNDTKIGDMVKIYESDGPQKHSLYTIVQGDNGIKKLEYIIDSNETGRYTNTIFPGNN